ncbi:M15 family metallopeptidase [Streptomyces sp. ISL-12]|uniref:M15 family metallopeptidase n=1 Tax=Streptomyces sp. ISL-12 TaxID=2819177 RepID=UPI001BE7F997|nr:M15 family metallopeptidase [Streptomyces sp. ISL-12]MBT2413305.1 M15 family metallopeptidase [Streptomyces sp. ISL-12]
MLFALASAILLTTLSGPGKAQAATDETAPAAFVSLKDVAPSILQDIRYYTTHNFVGSKIAGYDESLCILTSAAAQALAEAQQEFLAQGYSLKVYDCYRPQRAVDQFVSWAEDLDDELMKDEFYPQVEKSDLFTDGYIAAKSGHSRGSTVDLTLVKLPVTTTRPYVPGEKLVPCYAPAKQRFPDNSIDMGTGFDCFDTLSHTLDPRVGATQAANRMRLKTGLESVGFVNLAEEWWHFTLSAEPFPATYFDFPVSRASLSG